jgi:hypothetical protein
MTNAQQPILKKLNLKLLRESEKKRRKTKKEEKRKRLQSCLHDDFSKI